MIGSGDDVAVVRGAQDQVGDERDAEALGDQPQDGDVVLGLERDVGAEAGVVRSCSRWPRQRGQPAIQFSAARAGRSTTSWAASGWPFGHGQAHLVVEQLCASRTGRGPPRRGRGRCPRRRTPPPGRTRRPCSAASDSGGSASVKLTLTSGKRCLTRARARGTRVAEDDGKAISRTRPAAQARRSRRPPPRRRRGRRAPATAWRASTWPASVSRTLRPTRSTSTVPVRCSSRRTICEMAGWV